LVNEREKIILKMSFLLLALLITSNNLYVSSYKPPVPQAQFISSKLQDIQSKAKKVLGSLVIATTLVNFPVLDPGSINNPIVNAAQQRYNNKLNAPTAVGTRVNSDAESLLRYGTSFLIVL
jgi:hypothetical protein